MKLDSQNPSGSKFFCEICSNAEDMGVLPAQRPLLSNKNGILLPTLSQNKQLINNHASTDVHKALVTRLRQEKEPEVWSPIKMHESPRYIVTNRALRTIYTTVKSGVSLEQMSSFIQLQKLHGTFILSIFILSQMCRIIFHADLDMGTDCNSVNVFKKMIHSIHGSMMKRLADKLNSESTPLSIIVDSSTGGIFV